MLTVLWLVASASAFEVSSPGLVRGMPATFTATELDPGERVGFFVGPGLGLGPCPSLRAGVCLDLVGAAYVGAATADGQGTARLTVQPPSNLPWGTVFVQGIRQTTGISPPVQVDVTDANHWRPAPGTSWQWQLLGPIDTSRDVAMYDVDLFDVPVTTIDQLHADGRVVVCYFSAGSREAWRPDAASFPTTAVGRPLDGWPGERWLDVRAPEVLDVMRARMDLAVRKGCDGVEPDNVDGYANASGFPLTAADQRVFNRALAEEAHARGLSVGLKNDLDQIGALLPWFDWALDEECVSFQECALLQPFLSAGKAVFHVEYADPWSTAPAVADAVCPLNPGFSTLIKPWDLTAQGIPCALWPVP